MATPVVEAYLEMIYLMAVEGQPVIGARLAESLHVSRPTVTATLQRAAREGFVKFNAGKEIALTAKGQAIAEYLQRRHCVIERWLVDELGLDWANSDAQAHLLEHAMSDEVAELLNKKMGSPAACPHGNPIPGNVRSVAAINSKYFRLGAAREGDRLAVARVSEYDQNVVELLNYLGARGIRPGAELTITEIAPMKGPLTLKVGSRTVSLGREIANYVWVQKAE
ncbi:MAG: metal-dependent transcriptional regulator [Chloroflexi bacterium]|nr:metal-dependent transcriptional regulator [Chloroflexota bacterium]